MSGFVRFQTGEVRWQVRGDLARLLFASEGLLLPTWLQSGQATVVKHGPHRTVYRVQLADRTYYLKHYRVPDIRAMLSQWLQRSRGRREWEVMRRAAAHNVPTTVPVALGEQRRGQLVLENYLVTEGIEDAVSLFDFVRTRLAHLPEHRRGRVRRRLTVAVAELAAHMHEAGLEHRDLHAGNVLVRMDSDDTVRPLLIDLQAARLASHVGWRRSSVEILTLGINFLSETSAADRLRFLRRYLELRPSLGLSCRSVAAVLHAAMWRRARTAWWRRDAKCLSNNRRFFYRNIGRAHGFAVSEFGEPLLLALLRDPDTPLASSVESRVKDSSSSTVARLTLAVGGVPTPVIYKRCNCPKRLDPVRSTLYRSPALRAWIAGHALLNRGILTPRPLAVIERTPGSLVRENYIITEQIEGARTLKQYFLQVVPTLSPGERRAQIGQLAARLGLVARRLHERSISHRDMKASNFLLAPSRTDPAELDLYVIDLAGVQIWRRLPRFRWLQNLARIAVSMTNFHEIRHTDRLRFLRAYLPGRLRDRNRWKALWREIRASAERKIARNRGSGRIID